MRNICLFLMVIAAAAPVPLTLAEPTDSASDGAWQRLVEQCEQLDKTVWKNEVDAHAFERVFYSMWDELDPALLKMRPDTIIIYHGVDSFKGAGSVLYNLD